LVSRSDITNVQPRRIALDPRGDVYVIDSLGEGILRFDGRSGARLGTVVLRANVLPSSPDFSPVAVAIGPDNDLYVTSSNGRVYRFDKNNGQFLGRFAEDGFAEEPVAGKPMWIDAIDSTIGPGGNLYVARLRTVNLGGFIENFRTTLELAVYAAGSGAPLRLYALGDGFLDPLALEPGSIRALVAGPDGGLYFLGQTKGWGGSAIARAVLDEAGGISTELFVSEGGDWSDTAFGPDDRLYVLDVTAGEIFRFDPAGGLGTRETVALLEVEDATALLFGPRPVR
jgi:streptogramin lyase